MPVVFGSAANNCSKASKPPAEAPTPTIEVGWPSEEEGNRLNAACFAGRPFLPATFFGAIREARGALLTLERRGIGAFVFFGTTNLPEGAHYPTTGKEYLAGVFGDVLVKAFSRRVRD